MEPLLLGLWVLCLLLPFAIRCRARPAVVIVVLPVVLSDSGAERRIGQLMDEQRETVGLNVGAAGGGTKEGPRGSYLDPRDDRPTLAGAGIGKHLADRARKLAAVPEKELAQPLDGEAWLRRQLEALEKEGTDHVL